MQNILKGIFMYFFMNNIFFIFSAVTLADFLEAITKSFITSSIIMLFGMFLLVSLLSMSLIVINHPRKGLSIKDTLKKSMIMGISSCAAQIAIVLFIWFLMRSVAFSSLLNLLWLGFVLTGVNCALYFIYGFKKHYR